MSRRCANPGAACGDGPVQQDRNRELLEGKNVAARRVLNLGSGRKYLADAVNVDHQASTNPDLVHELNAIPWPLPDNHFETVLLADSLEHLEDVVATMEEIHRVCRHGAVVRITTPHFSSANSFTDPTHRHHFSYFF
jgi:SAM-dependent methyltransferase